MASTSPTWSRCRRRTWTYTITWYGQSAFYDLVPDTYVLNINQVGLKQLYVKLEFLTVTDLQRVRQHNYRGENSENFCSKLNHGSLPYIGAP